MGAEMGKFAFIALLGMVSTGTASAPLVTAKSTERFAECFAGTQNRRAEAWWFVPKPRGGTFSNLGAKGVRAPYFVVVSDRGAHREIRLTETSAAEARAARSCI